MDRLVSAQFYCAHNSRARNTDPLCGSKQPNPEWYTSATTLQWAEYWCVPPVIARGGAHTKGQG